MKFSHHTFDQSALTEDMLTNMPFAYDNKYAGNLAQSRGAAFRIVSFDGDRQGYIPILLKNAKLIHTVTLLYAPVDCDGNTFNAQHEQAILNNLVSFIGKTRLADRITQPINWALFQSYPEGSAKVPFGTYELDLNQGEEEIWKGLHSKHRNVVRNANKKGAELRTGKAELDAFHQLYQATMVRSSMYCEPKSYFENLMRDYEAQLYCAVVYQNNVPQGGIFVPYTKEGAYYVYGASADKITLTGANNYLHYKLIKFLIAAGVRKYDFVGARLSDISGTKFEGIQKFKRRFGGELKEGYLWKMDMNRVKCKIFDAALKAKTKIKGVNLTGDIIDQELKNF